jgi:RNA polymerase sigma-70 factor (ECF subfamily)
MTLDPAEIRQLIRLATKRTGSAIFDEDLAQEAALRALVAFRRTHHIEKPRAFLMKVVRDTVRDHWRRRRSSDDIATVDERFVSQSPDFESRIDETRRQEILHRALEALDPQKRSTVALFYTDELSVPEIARLQCRSSSAVKMELMRARRDLARIIRSFAKKKSR